MTPPVPMFLDCDTGIDDALALVLLLNSPEVDLVGVATVSGNIDAAGGARNTLDLLALAGRRDVPVAIGNHDPQVGSYHGGAPTGWLAVADVTWLWVRANAVQSDSVWSRVALPS